MPDRFKPLLDRSFLRSEFHYEYQDYRLSGQDASLLERLRAWNQRRLQGEREIEGAFIQRFFVDTWGYHDAGGSPSWTLQQQFAVPGSGATGAAGAADLALGYFGDEGTQTGQVLCEFKGVGSDLDRPQARKGTMRTPVEQGLDYLRHARRGLFGNEPVLPRFALVTNMNEFRLYWWDQAPERFLRFRISGGDLFDFDSGATTLLSENQEAEFDRFLFWRLLQPTMLLSRFGRPRMEALIQKQGTSERALEKGFYKEYRCYRTRLFSVIRSQPALHDVSGTETLRLTQKLLDRLIFVMFAEDMGMRVAFPLNLLRDQLKQESLDRFYSPNGTRVWEILRILFDTMRMGGQIGDSQIHRFNGGLFETDELLDSLSLPNYLFSPGAKGATKRA